MKESCPLIVLSAWGTEDLMFFMLLFRNQKHQGQTGCERPSVAILPEGVIQTLGGGCGKSYLSLSSEDRGEC